MNNGSHRNACRYRVLLIGAFLATIWLSPFAFSAGGEAARLEYFDNLVEELNAASSARSRIIELIYNELRGPNSPQMYQVLRNALGRPNNLVLQGSIEAMAMLGDPGDLAFLETLLATSSLLEAKTFTLRLLPAFCLNSNERARLNYIRYASGHERIANPAVLTPLRHPPLTRRGQLDPDQQRLQASVTRILVGQFDPAGAAMRYVDDLLYSGAARATVTHYIGTSLGNDPGRWTRLWEHQGGEENYLLPDEIEEIRLAALQSLSDMGAEGLPEVLNALERLMDVDSAILRQAVFETLAVMCRVGFESFQPLSEMSFSVQNEAETVSWRQRRFDAATELAVFAFDSAAKNLSGTVDSAVFDSVVDCLGAALSYPMTFPDPHSLLAKTRVRGLAVLERLLMTPDLSLAKRISVVKALGEVGGTRSVIVLQSILDSPYTYPEAGSNGMRMAEAAIDMLRVIATGEHEGRSAARELLLSLLQDPREFPAVRPGIPPIKLGHIVLWRLQRMAKSDSPSLDVEQWRERLGW